MLLQIKNTLLAARVDIYSLCDEKKIPVGISPERLLVTSRVAQHDPKPRISPPRAATRTDRISRNLSAFVAQISCAKIFKIFSLSFFFYKMCIIIKWSNDLVYVTPCNNNRKKKKKFRLLFVFGALEFFSASNWR